MILKIRNRHKNIVDLDVEELISIDGQPYGVLSAAVDDGDLTQRVCYLEGQMETVMRALFAQQLEDGGE